VKVIRVAIEPGLKEVEALVDEAPRPVMEGVEKVEAKKLETGIGDTRAIVEVGWGSFLAPEAAARGLGVFQFLRRSQRWRERRALPGLSIPAGLQGSGPPSRIHVGIWTQNQSARFPKPASLSGSLRLGGLLIAWWASLATVWTKPRSIISNAVRLAVLP